MTVVLVTGTNTGIGKTVTTAALAVVAVAAGRRVLVVKPAQTGTATDETLDVDTVRRLAGLDDVVQLAGYDEPLAPDTAARRSGRPATPVAELAAGVAEAARDHELVIVEGAGGVLVRFDDDGGTLLDLGQALVAAGHRVTSLVVTSLALGALNHTELTTRAIASAGLSTAGLVIGSRPATLDLAGECNLVDLPRVTGAAIVGAIDAHAGALEPGEFRGQAAHWLPGALTAIDAAAQR